MLVEQRHAGRGIGVEHLLGGDDLDLVRIDIESQFGARDLLAGVMDALQLGEIPVRSLKQALGCCSHGAAFSWFRRRWNKS